MSHPNTGPWFPAKRHGVGWGWPRLWQGWVVLFGFAAGLVGGVCLLNDAGFTEYDADFTFALTGLLVAICWLKGERPVWRRGR
jgi:hypothetical protein